MKLLYQSSQVPITQIYLVLPRCGACQDPAQHQGVSWLALRMLERGAGDLDAKNFQERLERLGASMHVALANSHAMLSLHCLSERLEEAVELFSLAFFQPCFEEEAFLSLRQQLVGSWIAAREETKRLRALDVHAARMYAGQATGYHSAGNLSGLRQTSLAQARQRWQHMRQHSQPFLATATNLSQTRLEKALIPLLAQADLQKPAPSTATASPPYPWDTWKPTQPDGLVVSIIEEEDTQTDDLVFGRFSAPQTHPQRLVHQLIAHIFGGDMNSRLFRVVRGEKGFSYGASCWWGGVHESVPANVPAPFCFHTHPSAQYSAQALPLMLQLYSTLCQQGVLGKELEHAKRSLINTYPFLRATPQKRLMWKMQQALYGLDLEDKTTYAQRVEAIGVQQVQEHLERYHHPDHLYITLLGSKARLLPVVQSLPSQATVHLVDTTCAAGVL